MDRFIRQMQTVNTNSESTDANPFKHAIDAVGIIRLTFDSNSNSNSNSIPISTSTSTSTSTSSSSSTSVSVSVSRVSRVRQGIGSGFLINGIQFDPNHWKTGNTNENGNGNGNENGNGKDEQK